MDLDRLGPEALKRLDRLLAALGLAAVAVLLVLGLAFVILYARGDGSEALLVATILLGAGLLATLCLITDKCPPLTY